jgi:type IV pilus assembly protein PilN
VILINLLPHREVKRAARKRAFFATLGASAVAGALVVGLWYAGLQQLTAAQQSRNAFLQAEITRLDSQIRDIANLRAEIDALRARQKAVEDLQTDRNIPVYLLDELVRQTPEGVYLATIRQTGGTVAVTGLAQTNERVSEFLRNTAYNSPWLERPELIEIKIAPPPQGQGARAALDQRRLFEFSMRVSLKRPQAADPAAPATGAAPARTSQAPAQPAAAS